MIQSFLEDPFVGSPAELPVDEQGGIIQIGDRWSCGLVFCNDH